HAVGAAKVAPVHDRDAQIVQGTAEAVERILRSPNVVYGRVHVIFRLPAVYRGDEAFRIGIGSRGQFDEAIGAGQAQKVSRSIRPPRIGPGASPIVVFDGHRQEI